MKDYMFNVILFTVLAAGFASLGIWYREGTEKTIYLCTAVILFATTSFAKAPEGK